MLDAAIEAHQGSPLDDIVLRVLRDPKSSAQIKNAIPYRFTAVQLDETLVRLRNAGRIACTNGTWWKR